MIGNCALQYNMDAVNHFPAKELYLLTDPPRGIQVDGEIGWETPVNIKVIPGDVNVLTTGS